MRPAPADWPRVSCAVFYDDPAKAIDWLRDAFGFEVRAKVEAGEGKILHSELTYGGGLIMVGDAHAAHGPGPKRASPRSAGGVNTQAIMVYVDDVEAHSTHAKAHGAVIVKEPETSDYGDDWFTDRSYGCTDPEGHFWWFSQRLKDATAKK